MIEPKILATLAEPRHALGAEASAFTLNLPPVARDAIKAVAGTGRVVLQFEDISVKGTPDTTYEVYLNLPAGQKAPGIDSPNYAGSLAFFGMEESADHANHAAMSKTISLNVTSAAAKLNLAAGDNLVVTLVPRQAGIEPGAAVRTQAVPTFRRILLTAE